MIGRQGRSPERGSKAEFEQLYRESFPMVYNYVRYRMSDPDAAEDVVAEAFMLAARSFAKFDPGRSKFSTWVITIALNCMRSYYRKAHPSVDIEDLPESMFSTPDEQEAVANHDLVWKLLGVLDEEERELVLMKYQQGMRNVDIAETLGMNASTVSTKLAKALAKMRVSAE